jgi:hypothetical protein
MLAVVAKTYETSELTGRPLDKELPDGKKGLYRRQNASDMDYTRTLHLMLHLVAVRFLSRVEWQLPVAIDWDV